MRTMTPLNFNWQFSKKGENQTLMVDIPHSNVVLPYNNFDETRYQFESVYTKTISIDVIPSHHYFLRFEGVLHHCTVFVNDQIVGTHSGGYTAFTFDVTDVVQPGDNHICVEVDSRETLNIPPFGKTIDYLTYGGIYREVTLIETPQNYIEDVAVNARNLLTEPIIKLSVATNGGTTLTVRLLDNHEIVFEQDYDNQPVISFSYPVNLWSIDQPTLYDIEIELDHNDHYSFRTGFKDMKFTTNGFYLNGKHTKIIGQNRHQMYPHVGYAMPHRAQYEDVQLLKTMGNAVRTSHYPPSKHFLDTCDEQGLLVFIEAPGWQHIGDDTWKEAYKTSVSEMVMEHRHHPSIILWGVRVNESGDDHPLYSTTNKLVHDLDDRPTGGVRCFSFSEPLEDVYTYNDFFHNGTNAYLKDLDEIIDHDKPYLITEFNGHMYPTKSFDPPTRKVEHAMRYAHILNDIYADKRISGGFGWQFIDYYTHSEFGSGDHICYHGVLDVGRMAKPAAFIYKSQFAQQPFMKLLHSMDIGDYDVGYIDKMYIATNCDYVDLYQNDRFISRCYPDNNQFPALPHPPIIIDDLFGTALEEEGLSKTKASKYKQLARLVASRGGLDKLTKHDNLDMDDVHTAWNYYGKYVANWGSKTFMYRMEGFYQGQQVTAYAGPYKDYEYDINISTNTLLHDDTYDVARVTIEALDNLGNIRSYAFDSFVVTTTGSIALIGEEYITLMGGKRAFWIRSTTTGKGTITIHNHLVQHTIELDVITKK